MGEFSVEKPALPGQLSVEINSYTRAEACRRLAANHGVIASFSRALVEDLKHPMSDAEFDAALEKSIEEIYAASNVKV